jgi:hypothetical protein
MSDQEYNGWTNYETWLVNLWMDNDPGSQDYYRETAKEMYDAAETECRGHVIWTQSETARFRLRTG